MKLSGGSLLISAGLGIASLALPAIIPLAVASTLYSIIVGGKSVRDVLSQHAVHKEEAAKFTQRPMALLFDIFQRRNAMASGSSNPKYLNFRSSETQDEP